MRWYVHKAETHWFRGKFQANTLVYVEDTRPLYAENRLAEAHGRRVAEAAGGLGAGDHTLPTASGSTGLASDALWAGESTTE